LFQYNKKPAKGKGRFLGIGGGIDMMVKEFTEIPKKRAGVSIRGSGCVMPRGKCENG
jgi:hypothetical protein